MTERVLILGGGAGGTLLANFLDPRRFAVTLVTASTDHLFQPGLLYVAFAGASGRRLVRDERGLLRRHVELVHDTVTHVDLADRVVTTAGGVRLDYDNVVIATGVTTDCSPIPGLPEVNSRFGDYHSNLQQARKLAAQLQRFQGGTIAVGQAMPVCKCPPSPLEGVLLVDQLLRRRGVRDKTRLVFFTPYPRPYPAEPISRVVEPVLEERGIEVMTFFDVDRVDPAARTIFSIEGDRIDYDLPIIVPPFVGMDIGYEPAEVLDQSRLVVTDKRSLRVAGFDNAFAIGDATNLPTSKAGVGAHLEAKVVARTLRGLPASFNGRTHCPFDFGDGRGTFVVGSYDAPVVPAPPTQLKHLLKGGFAHIYWLSLRGWLEPMFDVFFAATAPKGVPTSRPGPVLTGSGQGRTS